MTIEHTHAGLRALRNMNPLRQESFDPSLDRYQGLPDAIMSERVKVVSLPDTDQPRSFRKRATHPASGKRRRSLGLSAGAAMIVLAGIILGVTFLTGGGVLPEVSPAYAAEVVRKAAADTAAAESGVVETLVHQQDLDHGTTTVHAQSFAWHGDDFALVITAGDSYPRSELRYVSGCFYDKGYFKPEPPESETWFHYTAYDNGQGDDPGPYAASEPFVPGAWLETYRTALVGTGLTDLAASVSGLTQKSSAEDSTTYAGTLKAAELASRNYLGLSGVPFAGQPLEKLALLRPDSPVGVEIVVGADGLVCEATLRYEIERFSFSYQVTYSGLGSAPAVAAPDPASTVTRERPLETDGRSADDAFQPET